ncbi:putative bifunctional diguanylate cyclase/phosphodiesterase [Phytohabitans aurantiacus]|uniref:putative bifunctional diguanylate cyclase/phosphodiesterase n=1 Tax=Phytohabitans aurantiacus TaxID=3016789 RepID=UPI002492B86B|nr:EAL domain-containing protein [Phytohabitans aurantiacus]
MGSAALPEPRALTSWRVLVAVVALVILTVAAATLAVRAQIRSRALQNAVHGVEIVSSLVIDQSLTLTDITHGTNPINAAALNADVIMLKRRGEVVNLSIWSLATSQLVYSDVEPSAIEAPPPDVMARARKGDAFAVTDKEAATDTVIVYHPYDANGDGTMDAVAEVMLPRDRVDGPVAHSMNLVYASGALVLLLALAGILQVRRHQLRQDHAAVHDALTGLGNRLLLRRVAPPTLARATPERPAALLLIDLDNFKPVNDALGHAAGDELLVAAADLIREASGPAGVVVRFGGDEFAVLLGPLSGRGVARDVANEIRKRIRQPLMVAGSELEVGASVGMAWAPTDGAELSDLLSRADKAMYYAKYSGSGVAEYAATPETSPPDPRVTTLSQLGRALAGHELELFYQPVRGADAAVKSVEALPRWHHPQRGLLEAGMFIPAVAHTSVATALTTWVLRQAARQVAEWRADGVQVSVSVNVSARTLYNDALPDVIRTVAAEYGLPLSALELEVAEAILVRESARAIPAMLRLRDAGVGFCVDKFGAEYGAVSVLAEAPIQRVKIDQRFTGTAVEFPLARAIVGGWIRVAHQLGLTVVAQGVETPEASRCLVDLGCDEMQGFGIGRPMPAAELTRWLARPSAHAGPG